MKPRIAVTMGDPAGIGPEVIARSLAVPAARQAGHLLLVGSRDLLKGEVDRYARGLDLPRIASAADWTREGIAVLDLPVPEGVAVTPGAPDRHTSRMAGEAVREAAGLALDGTVHAIVTAPLAKRAFAEIGAPHRGHTEYLAWRAGVERFAMMFVAGAQRVILATTHLPLADVSESLSKGRIMDCVGLLDEALRRYFRIGRPRLGVAGLNPHAGEGGLLGTEEQEFIRPAVDECRSAGLRVTGPHPADSLFRRMGAGEFDGVVALYHDQALIPVKLLEPERAVNVTVGLPFIRTSVSHGTAFDIAGAGMASAASMVEALTLSARMVVAGGLPEQGEGHAGSRQRGKGP